MRCILVTGTLYENPKGTRAALALKTVEEARKRKLPIVVFESGSPPEFVDALRARGTHIIQEQEQNMGHGRRRAFEEAIKIGGDDAAYFWLEPEKWPLVRSAKKIVRPILKKRADMVIPKRRSLRSYPPEQMHTELTGNLIWRYLTGTNLDMFFGPFAMNRRTLQYVLDYKGEYGDRWESISIPRLRALMSGLKLVGVPVRYTHPKAQTREETGTMPFIHKRLDQLAFLTRCFEEELSRLKKA